MGDGAKEITKAGEEIFGSDGVRLMCWPHTHRNIVPRMSGIRKLNKNLCQDLLNDVKMLQWSCHSQNTFEIVFDLLENKYLTEKRTTRTEAEALSEFFTYFREQWGPGSPVSRWYEGAHPWHVFHNQGT